MEPRFNEPLYNEVLGITNDILQPRQSYSKMYGTEPRYNEPRYNEILVITSTIQKPKRKMYPDITNICQHATKDEVVLCCLRFVTRFINLCSFLLLTTYDKSLSSMEDAFLRMTKRGNLHWKIFLFSFLIRNLSCTVVSCCLSFVTLFINLFIVTFVKSLSSMEDAFLRMTKERGILHWKNFLIRGLCNFISSFLFLKFC